MVFKFDDNLRGARTEEIMHLDVAEIDIPHLVTVFDHWNRVRGDKTAPSLTDFRLEDIEPSIVPRLTIADFSGPPFDYRFRFFGSRVVEASGMELTGKKYYADNIQGFGYENSQIFPKIIEERCPMATRTTWISVKLVRYVSTALRMPLSAYGEVISGCVTAYHFA
ncbi:MAG: hypothetical protein JJ900_15730 [Rhodospirillales bacterium]|nr:hypothetical protein [Rhodospirillales bacterium]MBO6788298.1 hypothetical protein [Rhodospirillales bacterium]